MDYAALQSRSADMIADKGQTVTLTRHAAGSYDTSTGQVAVTDTTTVTTGVVMPIPSRGLRYLAEADEANMNIVIGDQILLLPGTISAPHVNDTATISGTDYTIIGINPLNPAGTALYFECFIRGVAA